MSWISKEEDILNDKNFDKKPLEHICCIFIFIDNNNNILKISKENAILETQEGFSILHKGKILEMIQQQKQQFHNNIFTYKHALKYIFNKDAEEIEDYIDQDDKEELTSIPLMDDVKFDYAPIIFHDLHSLYFIFEESKIPLKPILKIHDLIENVKPTKKRVTIKLSKNKKHKTRKNNI